MTIAEDINTKTGAQIVVVTIKSLEGMNIEEYSNRLFRSWGIGDKESNNGILFIVATQDKKMRIEIGQGLEGRIPDMIAGRIMDEYAKPYFVKNDFNSGIFNTYKALANEVGKEYNIEEFQVEKLENVDNRKKANAGLTDLILFFIALALWQQIGIIIIILFVIWMIFKLGIFLDFGGFGGGIS